MIDEPNKADSLEEYEQFVKRQMKEILPSLDLEPQRWGSTTTGKTKWNHLEFGIPPENSRLLKTRYYFKEKELIHFTRLDSIESIISSLNIRLYNLNHLEDPREFHFAADLFNLSQPFRFIYFLVDGILTNTISRNVFFLTFINVFTDWSHHI